ncbi:hypothetical protein SBRY_80270 [Actinacidiphila bryophytorum]|uniref:Uncharacterized protein n=1 Tax=Actinacidiphila bryophytorum TaxID=1436133 RepID=A0A9W4H8A1_9ACTN|nr:hypothetical protein SBRY_80270 [Actinacidiphila bryophytorum]
MCQYRHNSPEWRLSAWRIIHIMDDDRTSGRTVLTACERGGVHGIGSTGECLAGPRRRQRWRGLLRRGVRRLRRELRACRDLGDRSAGAGRHRGGAGAGPADRHRHPGRLPGRTRHR